MGITSFYFLVFYGIVLILYYVLPKRWQWGVLLIASIFYYLCSGNAILILYPLLAVAVSFAGIYWMTKAQEEEALLKERGKDVAKRRKAALLFVIFANVAVLFLLKYINFGIHTINAAASFFGAGRDILSGFNWLVPLGISYYSLSLIGYVVDVYFGIAVPQKNPAKLALYGMFFPVMVSGPILRYREDGEQFFEPHLFDYKQVTQGMQRMLWGFFKELVISERMALIVNTIYGNYEAYPGVYIWIGTVAFAFQLYTNFSGGMDIVLGLAQTFGLKLPENFRRPFFSKNISEYWRRWHISLSSWFRDYVYIPLGGSRVSKIKHIRNLLIVWFLTGLWHGAAWNFVAWGLYYGVILIIEKYLLSPVLDRLPDIVRHIYSIVLVVIGWVLFFSSSFGQAADYIRVMFGAGAHGFADRESMYLLTSNLILWLILIFGSTPLVHFRYEHMLRTKKWNTTIINSVVYAALFIVCIAYLVTETYNPFLYFRF